MKAKAVPPADLRAAVARICASQSFARAPRAADLLKYLVEKAVGGRADEIKEYTVALECFGRASYDPKLDSLVRVEAAKLRQLLASYYEGEGRNDFVRIEIPRGSYRPSFCPLEAPRRAWRSPPWPILAALLAGAILLGSGGWWWTSTRPPAPTPLASIAVLPFVDLSPGKDREYFCDGLTEEVTRALAGLEGLRVASRTSAFGYRAVPRDVRRIGRELSVQAVLEGSVTVDGDLVRVAVQLVNAGDGFQFWADTYVRRLEDVLAIQQQIAEGVAKSFSVSLLNTARALARPGTRNPDAWHYCLRATHFDNEGETAKAVELFQAAVRADPDYARAWAGLAIALTTRADFREVPPLDVLPQAAEAARRAVALNPSLAEAQRAAGRVKVFYERDWAGGEGAFRRAIGLDSTQPDIRYDFARLALNTRRRFPEAMAELEKAIAVAPSSNHLRNELAATYIKARRWEEALPPLEVSLTISHASPAVFVMLGQVACGRGDAAGALWLFEQVAAIRSSSWLQGHRGHTLARLGRVDEARKVLAELGLAASGAPANYEAGVIHAALGETDQAFACLNRAVDLYETATLWLEVDDRLAPLRPDPRFSGLLQRLRLE
jgi:serine/threonine-protein kinase